MADPQSTITQQQNAYGDATYWREGVFSNTAGPYMGIATGPYEISASLRFSDCLIPAGATIISATITVKSSGNYSVGTSVKIYLNDVDNAVAPTTQSEGEGLALTTQSATWMLGGWTAWTTYQSADFSAALQAVIDRAQWKAGNAIQVVLTDPSGFSAGQWRQFQSRDVVIGDSPILTVTFSHPNIQVFQSSGTFKVPAGVDDIDVLLVGGAGGGGSHVSGGGGGAGGVKEFQSVSVTPEDEIAVTIGAGGAGGSVGSANQGTDGGSTSFSNGGDISLSVSGGGGGGKYSNSQVEPGRNGASGGGGGYRATADSAGGTGISGEGYAGGTGGGGTRFPGGGGGGAGSVGANRGGDSAAGALGGSGKSSTHAELSSVVFGMGGQGGSYNYTPAGGAGGGGLSVKTTTGTAGRLARGCGGGGGGYVGGAYGGGGSGSAGMVVVTWETAHTMSGTITFTASVSGEDATIRDNLDDTVTLTDTAEGENPTIKVTTSDGASFAMTVDGDAPKGSVTDAGFLSDQPDGYPLKGDTTEQASVQAVVDGQVNVDGAQEHPSIQDAWARSIETEREATASRALIAGLMDGYALSDGLDEIINLAQRGYGILQNPHRRKQMLWNILDEHVSLKFRNSQAGKGAQLIDCAIRCGRVMRQDPVRWVHLGQHIQLKFQHNELGESAAASNISMQVNRIDNPSAAPRDIQSVRFVHQGSHMNVMFRNDEKSKSVLLKSLAMTVNRTDNPR